ncbi:MAG: hypothetical protein V2I27_03495 [Erythrobacter sp.]|jgi:mono/diheme cytochrome c family protein|nr:hypothetical protein [Erythrobacter sp.]
MNRTAFLALAPLTLAACETTDFIAPYTAASGEPRVGTGTKWNTGAPERVPTLVQGVCGDCHGVEPPFLSPNPQAPGFDAIANSAGLTGESLTRWLIDAHNYPELMEFALSEDEARVVAAYMVTLQREDWRPAQ